MSFNPSDLHTDNLDAANADWEEYAEWLDSTHDDAEQFELNQLAMDHEFDDFEVEDEFEADAFGMDFGWDGMGEDEFGF